MGSKGKAKKRRRKEELLYSYALKRFLKNLEEAMAIGPDAILNSIQPLKPEDTAQVDTLEKLLDQYLTDNYHEDGVMSWTIPEVLTLDQTRELCKRYRKSGWRVLVYGEPESRFLILSRERGVDVPQPESDVPM